MSIGCPDENMSLHYDPQRSKGVIQNDETLIVVLNHTKQVGADRKPTSDAFRTDRLRDKEASVARKAYTSSQELNEYVIEPMLGRGEVIIGLCTTLARKVREISAFSPDQKTRCQAFCVLDIVRAGESDGHGIIAFSEELHSLTTNQNSLGYIRSAIRAELARTFSVVAHSYEAL